MTVLEIVREHNRLNGFRFVIVEFLLVTAAALWICAAGAAHGKPLPGISGAGIAMNAIVVVICAAGQLRAHEPQVGIVRAYSPEMRKRLASEYPGITAHTGLLVALLLVPFVLFALSTREWLSGAGRHK